MKNSNNGQVTVLPPKKICKICGAEVESTAYFCGNCGFAVKDLVEDFDEDLTEPDYQTVQETTTNNIQQQQIQNNNFSVNEIVCPNCGSKKFKSCQMIYTSGTRTRTFSSSTGYRSQGSNSSILAQNSAPPFQKKTYWIYSIILIGMFLFRDASSIILPLIAAVIIFGLTINEFSRSRSKKRFQYIFMAPVLAFVFLVSFIKENIFIQTLISDVAFIVGSILFVKTFYNSYWNKQKYPKLYNDWLNTFVCSRCGTFFTHNRNF